MQTLTAPVKLSIVDDHNLFRKGIVNLIKNASEDYTITVEAGDGNDLISQLHGLRKNLPDIIMVDIKMPNKDGFETVHWLKSNYPHIKVVVLSMFNDEKSVIRMLKLGVDGYLTKNIEPEEFFEALQSVTKKGYCYSDFLTGTLIHSVKNEQAGGSPQEIWLALSEREKEFVRLTCTEMTYSEIAVEMKLSAKTIDGYRDNVFSRFKVRSRVGIVLYAIKNDIIPVSALQ